MKNIKSPVKLEINNVLVLIIQNIWPSEATFERKFVCLFVRNFPYAQSLWWKYIYAIKYNKVH